MCFSLEMAATLVAVGTVMAIWTYKETRNGYLASGILYFVLMELLQVVQYLFIAEDLDSPKCDNPWNKWLTIAGFLHISFQPFFTHMVNAAFYTAGPKKQVFSFLLRLCLLQGCFMFGRVLMADPETDKVSYEDNVEWVRGDKVCTYQGERHLAWSLILKEPTYYTGSNFIHFFMMFMPFFAMESHVWPFGMVLMLGGPILASYLTPNLHEQASIWCFFSILQLVVLCIMMKMKLGPKGRWYYNENTQKILDESNEVAKKAVQEYLAQNMPMEKKQKVD